MAISTFEVVMLLLLFVVLLISIWWFSVAEKFRIYLQGYTYGRGANAWKAGQTLNLTCGAGKEICVYRATQICTDPNQDNLENYATDPIASGLDSNDSYGDFNSQTTVDLTDDMSDACNGSSTCSFKFTPKPFPGGMTCGGNTQLISTYSCIPSGILCQSYKSM